MVQKIATVYLKLEHTDPYKTYTGNIPFDNLNGDTLLPLRHQNSSGKHYLIPDTSTFGGWDVTPMAAIPWTNLDKVNSDSKIIGITDINQVPAEQGPEGDFLETIIFCVIIIHIRFVLPWARFFSSIWLCENLEHSSSFA